MQGEKQRRLYDALLAAFPEMGSLRRMVRFGLNQNLDVIANTSRLSDATFELIRWAESRGDIAALLVASRNSNPENPALRLVAEELQLAPVSGELESIVIKSVGFTDVEAWRARMSRAELAVCRIEQVGQGIGTGFLIGPNVVITNHHVVEDVVDGVVGPHDVRLRFDYKTDSRGTTVQAGQEYKLASDWLIDSSPNDELDYALLRVEGNPGESSVAGQADAPTRGWLVPRAYSLIEGEPLFIVQHPEARSLAISAGSFLRHQTSPKRIIHTVSTIGGSSGSPCFKSDWELVALHRAGSTRGNEAIPFSAIVPKLPPEVVVGSPVV